MGNLVFQATLGGQVNLVGPNTASTYNINVPAVAGDMVTTGDTGTVTNTMLAGSIANNKLTNSSVTIGSTSVALGATASTVAGLTLTNPTINGFTGDTSVINVGSGQFYKDTSGNVGIGTSSPTARLNIVNATSQDALRITQTGAGNALVVEDSTNPDSTPFLIDQTGIVVTGYTASQVFAGATYQYQMNTGAPWAGVRWNAASTGPTALLGKSRSATVGTNAIVSSGDAVGAIAFAGDDGTQFVQAASISAAVDGTPGTNDMPGRLVFTTTAAGASSPTERMRIDSAGNVGIGAAPPVGNTVRIAKNLTGATAAFSLTNRPAIQSDVTSSAAMFDSFPSTAAASFTLPNLFHYQASQNTFGLGSSVTNQYGFSAGSSLTGATNNYGFYSNIASGTGRWNFYAAGTADNYFAGNVGIGTSSPATKLNVSGQTRITDSSNSANYMTFGVGANAPYGNASISTTTAGLAIVAEGAGNMTFLNNGSERARIDSSGNLLVGTTTSRAKTTVKGATSDTYGNSGIALERVSVANYWNILPASTNDLYFGYNGADKGYIRQSDGAYISLSDERIKKNISDIQYGLSEVLALRPCSYHMAEQQDEDNKTLGFIAQESLKIVPETVFEMQGGMYGMDKTSLIPVLVKAIQEQQAIITQLQADVAALKGQA